MNRTVRSIPKKHLFLLVKENNKNTRIFITELVVYRKSTVSFSGAKCFSSRVVEKSRMTNTKLGIRNYSNKRNVWLEKCTDIVWHPLKTKNSCSKTVSKQRYQKEKKILSTLLKKKGGGGCLRGNVAIEKFFCFRDTVPHEKQQPQAIC